MSAARTRSYILDESGTCVNQTAAQPLQSKHQNPPPCCSVIRMDPKNATLTLLNRIWVKLQGLPTANEIEVAGFFILLIFICEYHNLYSC